MAINFIHSICRSTFKYVTNKHLKINPMSRQVGEWKKLTGIFMTYFIEKLDSILPKVVLMTIFFF
jgi:hypothetical protein